MMNKAYFGATLFVFFAAAWASTTAKGQTAADTPQADVAIAKAATYRPGHDFSPLTDQLCAEPNPQEAKPPQPAPAVQSAAAFAARKVPPRSSWCAEPAKVFDNLYYVGTQIQSMWAVKTSQGIILHDTSFDYSVQTAVDEGFPKVGLDPTQIKYIIVAHAHTDHYLGARYLQQKYHAHVIMSEADWNVLAKDDTPAEFKPEKDMVATDGMKLTLGDTTLTLYITPGHTPGTITTLFPLSDKGQRHLGVLWGGTAVPQTRGYSDDGTESIRLYNGSAKRMKEISAKAGADVLLSSHTNYDKTLDMINAIRFRNPGDTHPFVSKDAVQRWFTIAYECTAAQMLWKTHTSSSAEVK